MIKQIHKKISVFVRKNQLIEKGDELILGVSGGADSMMLLHYFNAYKNEYGVTLKVAHIHHGVRESAEGDATLVRGMCEAYQIPFFRHDCNIKELAKVRKQSEEEVGRTERYNFFISLLKENAKIVTAHNMNDQAETMMMRFFRGTDVKGLSGILPKREQIIRPLLCLTREEIEVYCEVNKVSYRQDETNFMPIYTRNKIRLNCTPYIEKEINPSLIKVLGTHSELYREEDAFLEAYTRQRYLEISSFQQTELILAIHLLEQEHIYMQKRILMMAIREFMGHQKDISLRHITDCITLLQNQSGKEIHLPEGIIVRKIYDKLILTRQQFMKAPYCTTLRIGSEEIPEIGARIKLAFVLSEELVEKQENLYTKYIDYGKIKNGLQIRTRQPEDYISVGTGKKKLKKLFIDDKISKDIRDTLPLVADGNEIIWVIGGRLNTNYYVTPQTTKILEIQMMNAR